MEAWIQVFFFFFLFSIRPAASPLVYAHTVSVDSLRNGEMTPSALFLLFFLFFILTWNICWDGFHDRSVLPPRPGLGEASKRDGGGRQEVWRERQRTGRRPLTPGAPDDSAAARWTSLHAHMQLPPLSLRTFYLHFLKHTKDVHVVKLKMSQEGRGGGTITYSGSFSKTQSSVLACEAAGGQIKETPRCTLTSSKPAALNPA